LVKPDNNNNNNNIIANLFFAPHPAMYWIPKISIEEKE
jgi:hypothetical protein